MTGRWLCYSEYQKQFIDMFAILMLNLYPDQFQSQAFILNLNSARNQFLDFGQNKFRYQIINCVLQPRLTGQFLNSKKMSFRPSTSLSYITVIEKMFDHVKSSLKYLLGYLTSIYQAHGINYDVNPLFNTILRMLTPFELLTFFNLTSPTDIISSMEGSNSSPYYNLASFSQKLLQNQPKFSELNPSTEIPKTKKEKKQANLGFSRNSQKDKVFSQHDSYRYASQGGKIIGKNTIYRLSNGGKPALNQKQEGLVCNFIQDQVRKGRILSMGDIAAEAKRIAYNTPYFMASQGWVKNFFVRHPDMKELYKLSRFNANSVLLPSSYKIDQSQLRIKQSMIRPKNIPYNPQPKFIRLSSKSSESQTHEKSQQLSQEYEQQQSQPAKFQESRLSEPSYESNIED